MRFSLTRHGGFTGVRLPPLVVDTAALPHAVASELERLVSQLKDRNVNRDAPAAAPKHPDGFSYTLTIAEPDGGEMTFTIDETNRPPELERLVHMLQGMVRK